MTLFGLNTIFLALVFTAFSGIIALGGRSTFFHKASQALLVVSGVLGFISSVNVFLNPTVGSSFTLSLVSFAPSFGLDLFGAVFFSLISLATILCALFAIPYLASYKDTYHLPTLNFTTAAFILGMQLVVLSTGPLSFMLAWETMSIASFFLVMADRSQHSIRAAFLYLVMTHIGAAAIMSGFLLLSQGNIWADFTSLAAMGSLAPEWLLTLVFGLFLFGFGSKAGLVPFHVWLPEAHPAAPSHISALMSGVMLKVAIYGFVRVLLFILPPIGTVPSLVILGLGLLTAIYGVLYAVIETDFKRCLAFSSVENIGIIFCMLGVAFFAEGTSPALFQVSLVAAVFFLVAHAIFKTGLFLSSGIIIRAVHSRSLEVMGGLANRLPSFSMYFCILSLAAASLPPFGPFFGEWMFFQGLVQSLPFAGGLERAVLLTTFAGLALVGGLAIFTMVKLFGLSMLAEPRSEHARDVHEMPRLTESFAIAATAVFILALGIYAPAILAMLGGGALVSSPVTLTVGSSTIQPNFIFWVLLCCLLAVFIVRRLTSRVEHERIYHSWDCGQPIDASMEYTATSFSAPIRFFFRLILRTKKQGESQPVVASNPWIVSHTSTIHLRSIWMDFGYTPLGRFLLGIAEQVKKIQNGNIRFYLFLIFVTLILTLWVAL